MFPRLSGGLLFSRLLIPHLLAPPPIVALPQERLPAFGFFFSFDSSSTWSLVPCKTGPLLKAPLLENLDAILLLPVSQGWNPATSAPIPQGSGAQPPGYATSVTMKKKNSPSLLRAHARPCAEICSNGSRRSSHTLVLIFTPTPLNLGDIVVKWYHLFI